MGTESEPQLIELDTGEPIWERFFGVYPLVPVGSREPDGSDDLAPKHLAMPVSWQNYFGFVCAETHSTYRNVRRERQFTVTYAQPSQAVLAARRGGERVGIGSGARGISPRRRRRSATAAR